MMDGLNSQLFQGSFNLTAKVIKSIRGRGRGVRTTADKTTESVLGEVSFSLLAGIFYLEFKVKK
jgi:hypothetical protein